MKFCVFLWCQTAILGKTMTTTFINATSISVTITIGILFADFRRSSNFCRTQVKFSSFLYVWKAKPTKYVFSVEVAPTNLNNDIMYTLILYVESMINIVEKSLNNFIKSRWAQNISWTTVDSHLFRHLRTYLWSYKHLNKCCISALMEFLNLSYALYTYFIFIKLSFLLPFKPIRACLGSTKFFVRSTRMFFSIYLPTRRWPPNLASSYNCAFH